MECVRISVLRIAQVFEYGKRKIEKMFGTVVRPIFPFQKGKFCDTLTIKCDKGCSAAEDGGMEDFV